MEQEYIIREGNPGLVLLFGGWGAGPELFREYSVPEGYDFLLCYDYRDMSFDRSVLEGYRKIRLAAWSMGVWAAGQVFGDGIKPEEESGERPETRFGNGTGDLIWENRTAIGGTPFPIDDFRGIPEAVFDGTLTRLSWIVLEKFRRRMCGASLEHFMAHLPHRNVDELKEELVCIRDAVKASPGVCSFKWDTAIVGSSDMIFPASNQIDAWKSLGVEVQLVEGARHYDPSVFRKVLKPFE